jgi:acyl-[acyl-carrier-protein]-phospholipid O-acyltransferase/long-chain-fatty-acid--[acyl-carrier-protein] ligase
MLLPNHSSWIDWLFVAVCLDNRWRFVTSKEGAQVSWVHRLLMINRFTFPVETDSPYASNASPNTCKAGASWWSFPKAAFPAPAR